jgi:hypothetical protein
MTIDPGAYGELLERPFGISDQQQFNALAMDLFHLHAEKNAVYRTFLDALKVDPRNVVEPGSIPFLPIGFFRNHRVLLEGLEPAITFTSSGTTGPVTSSHHVPWPEVYERSFRTSFTATYGDPAE